MTIAARTWSEVSIRSTGDDVLDSGMNSTVDHNLGNHSHMTADLQGTANFISTDPPAPGTWHTPADTSPGFLKLGSGPGVTSWQGGATAGVNLYSVASSNPNFQGVQTDCADLPRPSGNTPFDLGAYEYDSAPAAPTLRVR